MAHAEPTAPELESLPVFPLPSTVLFPGIVVPLHIFEPRYREMVSDAMAGERLLAIVQIRPGTEAEAQPQLYDVAGVGRIIHCEKLIGGRYNILVQGVARAQLVAELPQTRAYRCFRARLIPEPTAAETEAAKHELLQLERSVISLIANVIDSDSQLVEVVRSTTDPVVLADILAATVLADSVQQQEILAANDLKARVSRLNELMVDVLVRVGEIPPEAQAN